MNWKQRARLRVGNDKYPTLTRVKIGRVLSVIAAAPIGTSWMFAISIPMSNQLSPGVLLKTKINDFETWRKLR